jgi:hypothetical protein
VGLFLMMQYRPLKIFPMNAEAGIPLAHYQMDPLHEEFPGLLVGAFALLQP